MGGTVATKKYYSLVSREPIAKGWSVDKKYCATSEDGTKYLLRIAPQEKCASRAEMFRMQRKLEAFDIPMCKPVEFGLCEEGVYIIQTWIDGEDAKPLLPKCSQTEQYEYGADAGRILQKIHSIPAPETQEDWESRYRRKIEDKIQKYKACSVQYENGQRLIDYIRENSHLLKGRPQVFQHGDYHIGNMMIDRERKLQIIDFDRCDFGDPWEEFKSIVWCAQKSPRFASGMVDEYFDGHVPTDFWKLLALYIAGSTLASVHWAIPFGQKEVDTMLNLAKDVLLWYDQMHNPVPTWYAK